MPLILHIDTALGNASVGISEDKNILAKRGNEDQKNHAAFVQPAIAEMVSKLGISLAKIDAVSVSIGPGSYTGLRVGLASAKGICHALNKPLITVNTLEIMALAAVEFVKNSGQNELDAFFCPMIDARRMEVFTAVYTSSLQIILPPTAMVLEEDGFSEIRSKNPVFFSGDGSNKLKDIIKNENALFLQLSHSIAHLAMLAIKKFYANEFADLAYCEPFYAKPFYSPPSKKTNI